MAKRDIERKNETTEVRSWDWWGRFLQRGYYGSIEERRRWQRAASDVLDLLDVPAGGSFLDLGSGSGELLLALAENGYRGVGLELSRTLVDDVNAIAVRRSLDVEIVAGTMFDDSVIPTGPFDAILSTNTSFGYGDDHQNRQLFDSIRSRLSRSGSFLLDLIVSDSAESFGTWTDDLAGGVLRVDNRWDAERREMISHPSWRSDDGGPELVAPDPERVRIYSIDEIESMLTSARFEIERIRYGPGRQTLNERGPNSTATWIARPS